LLYIITPLHIAASVLLVVLVLLHSGKGGGLSDMFGGGIGASAAGSTVMEKNLNRITVILAVMWSFTTIALGMLLTNT
jgi:preprotein translocase subunit SecG